MWRNTAKGYGLLAILLHWLVALAVVGLFGLGLWMVELTYYDDWYRAAPDLHKSVGIVLFVAVLIRLLWRAIDRPPAPIESHGPIERRAAALVHALLYALLLAVMASGYLISTADGRGISVFGLFEVPATLYDLPNQADLAGDVHLVLAVTLVALAAAHALAALEHQLVDRDGTLMRMLRPATRRSPPPQTHEAQP